MSIDSGQTGEASKTGDVDETDDSFTYQSSVRQELLIEPSQFTREDMARYLGSAIIKPAFSMDYGEGFQALIGDKVAGQDVLVVRFLPTVKNDITKNSMPKLLPTVEAESGYWRDYKPVVQPVFVGSKLVVERVEQIAALSRGEGEAKGLRFAGTSGQRLVTLDIWGNTETILFDQSSDSADELPDVIEEVEMLRRQK